MFEELAKVLHIVRFTLRGVQAADINNVCKCCGSLIGGNKLAPISAFYIGRNNTTCQRKILTPPQHIQIAKNPIYLPNYMK